jgi:GNAT superfamily N-acetyltransferase
MGVRPRSDTDLEACVRLLEEAHRLDGYPSYWPADAARWLSPSGVLGAWVAEEAGCVIGHVALAAVRRGHGADIWSSATGVPPAGLGSISRLFVAPDRRHTGLGAALLDAACAASVERGLLPVLDVVETNREAIRFYERQGWRRVHSELWREARNEHLDLHYYVGPAGEG